MFASDTVNCLFGRTLCQPVGYILSVITSVLGCWLFGNKFHNVCRFPEVGRSHQIRYRAVVKFIRTDHLQEVWKAALTTSGLIFPRLPLVTNLISFTPYF